MLTLFGNKVVLGDLGGAEPEAARIARRIAQFDIRPPEPSRLVAGYRAAISRNWSLLAHSTAWHPSASKLPVSVLEGIAPRSFGRASVPDRVELRSS